MRDIFVTLVVFGLIPVIFWRPWIGILAWSWLGYMNPHRLAWGFSTTMPFALMIALATFAAILFSREQKHIPWTRETKLLLLFTGWMFITTVFAMYPWMAWPQWEKVWRIMLMTFVTLMLINERERVHWLVVVIALSLAFYGVKGGIFVLTGGAGSNVRGPNGSFIDDRNSIGLALIMTVPLLWYLRLQLRNALMRWSMIGAGALSLIAVIGTNSRGALVGILVMGLVFLLKARNRFGVILAVIPVVVVVLYVMPEEWFARMHTMTAYDEDASAQGRFYAWGNAIELANMSLFGGGYRAIAGYGGTDSHSNWFGVLGEHGWIGLLMFVLLHVFTWQSASRVIRLAKSHEELTWARDLAAMIQVSLVGYMSAGSFLGLQYFDLFYHLVVIVVIVDLIVKREIESKTEIRGGASAQSLTHSPERPPPGLGDARIASRTGV